MNKSWYQANQYLFEDNKLLTKEPKKADQAWTSRDIKQHWQYLFEDNKLLIKEPKKANQAWTSREIKQTSIYLQTVSYL